MPANDLNLVQVKQLMRAADVTQLYLKRLAENDNSKNQVYLGPDFTALNVLPGGELIGDPEKPERLKAAVRFGWLSSAGSIETAPHAQLILYPQYPEVRFSGFLRGCTAAPNDIMTVRQSGRFLFFGITAAGHVVGFATSHDSELAREIESLNLQPDTGVFSQIALEDRVDERAVLIAELARISALEWIDSKRLNTRGEIVDCNAPNCGGYTLEMNLYSDEADEDDIEFDEIVLVDDNVGEPESFNEDEAAMADLEIDWYPADSGGCQRTSR